MKTAQEYAKQVLKVHLDSIKDEATNIQQDLVTTMLGDLIDKIEALENKLDDKDDEIERLEQDVQDAQLTDDQREALELVDELKTCTERFNFGVESEGERIKEIHKLLTECGDLNA
jgi:chromosome segregation ATPase